MVLYICTIDEVLETRIGVVDVKSSLVHFHVERSTGYQSGGLIKVPFERQLLNLGNGFYWVNQWFTAPYNGTYFFSISGTKVFQGNGRTGTVFTLNQIMLILHHRFLALRILFLVGLQRCSFES